MQIASDQDRVPRARRPRKEEGGEIAREGDPIASTQQRKNRTTMTKKKKKKKKKKKRKKKKTMMMMMMMMTMIMNKKKKMKTKKSRSKKKKKKKNQRTRACITERKSTRRRKIVIAIFCLGRIVLRYIPSCTAIRNQIWPTLVPTFIPTLVRFFRPNNDEATGCTISYLFLRSVVHHAYVYHTVVLSFHFIELTEQTLRVVRSYEEILVRIHNCR